MASAESRRSSTSFLFQTGNGLYLTRDLQGSLWVGILAEGPGLGLGKFVDGTVKPFVTPAFDGSKVVVLGMTLDHDGNLWVATGGKGVFRIHGKVIKHYGQKDGLSGDTVYSVFEDRERTVWVAS